MIIQTPISLIKGRGVCKTANGIEYAQPTNNNEILGFVVSSVPANSFVEIREKCVLYGFSGLTTGQSLYLSYDGTVTNVPPSTDRLQELGVALSPTTILVQMKKPVYLTESNQGDYFNNNYVDNGYTQ